MGLPQHKAVILMVTVLVACTMCCGAAFSEVLQTKSDIKGASLVSLGTLQRSPESGPLDEYCNGYRAKKLTTIGSHVASLGWIVTSEAQLGRYHVVTFASGFTAGTSAMCFARNANIGVFDGSRLIALAFTPRSAKRALGIVEPLESGALLIWGDPPGWPVGELHEGANSLRLTAISAERTFCHRRAVVPNVYGKPLDVARKILIAHGWLPLRRRESPDEWDPADGLAKHGVVEAEACSGTGVGYCSLKYRGPVGVLRVTTAGGDPNPANNSVVGYGVACSAQ